MIQYEFSQLEEDFKKAFGRDPHRTNDFELVIKEEEWEVGHSAQGELGTWVFTEHNGLSLKFELTGENVCARLVIEWVHDGYSWFDVSVYGGNYTPLGTSIGRDPVSEDKLKAILEADLKRLREMTRLTKALMG